MNVLQMHGGGISGESRPLLVERMKPLSSLQILPGEILYNHRQLQ